MLHKKAKFRGLIAGAACALLTIGAFPAWADNDSNADADGGFHAVVAKSDAVMIRVPINERGDENTDAAEMRLITGTSERTAPANLIATWNTGLDVSNQPTVSSENSSRDSSTSRWGWSSWRGYGWRNNYYYNSYRPYYYYGYGYPSYSYYSYGYPYYNNYYYGYGYPYYGWRYYYYPSAW